MKKVREGYKMSELGEIPEEWSIVKLSDLSQKIGDGLHGTPKYVENSDYYFINGNNLVCGKVELYEDTKMVSEEDYIKNNKDLNENSLLISLNGTIGNVAYYNNEKIMLGKSSGYINLKGNINKKYIYYVLKTNTVLEYFNKELTGTTIKNLSLSTLRNTPIPLPNIREQEKIALILSTVDEQIDNVDALIEKNKELKKGLMQTLLTKGIGHTKFKKTEIGEIPEKWEVKNVSDVAEKVCVGFVGSLNKYYTSSEKGIPMIRTTNLSQKGLLLKDLKYVTNEFHIKNKKSIVKKNDILVARHGESGKACLVDCDIDANCLNIVIIRPDTNTINPQYLKEIINSESVIKQVNNSIVGSVQNVVNTKTIAELKMAIPSIEEQEKIVLILSEVDDKIEEYENKKQKLEELKKGLMQQLLTGMIRVTV